MSAKISLDQFFIKIKQNAFIMGLKQTSLNPSKLTAISEMDFYSPRAKNLMKNFEKKKFWNGKCDKNVKYLKKGEERLSQIL